MMTAVFMVNKINNMKNEMQCPTNILVGYPPELSIIYLN